MDSRPKWFALIVDLLSLLSEWERRHTLGHPWRTRFREIYSACMFTLCLEHKTAHRYLIGFRLRDKPTTQFTVSDLFRNGFAEFDDTDVVLIHDPKKPGASSVLYRRYQLVSFTHQPSTQEVDVVAFLERGK